MHFRQLAFTAGAINRTIVLPNVGGSRLGACLPHDFSFYYSTQWARDHSDSFSHITMADFLAWVKERKALGLPATSQNLHIHLGRGHKQMGESANCIEPLMDMALPDRRLYLEDSSNVRRRRKYESIIQDFLTGQPTERPAEEVNPEAVDELSLESLMGSLEVLSIYYDRR